MEFKREAADADEAASWGWLGISPQGNPSNLDLNVRLLLFPRHGVAKLSIADNDFHIAGHRAFVRRVLLELGIGRRVCDTF